MVCSTKHGAIRKRAVDGVGDAGRAKTGVEQRVSVPFGPLVWRNSMTDKSTQKARLVEYLNLRAEQLSTHLAGARLFVGTTDIGSVTEHAVRDFLASLLPARYSIGVGEVIGADGTRPDRFEQSQQKDLVIYDKYINTILSWDNSGLSLFPLESVYGVVEVKTAVRSADDLNRAVRQALEAKRLCLNRCTHSPITAVFAFESQVSGQLLFDTLAAREPGERPDFVIILRSHSDPENGCYLVHWDYSSGLWRKWGQEWTKSGINCPFRAIPNLSETIWHRSVRAIVEGSRDGDTDQSCK